MNARTVQVTQAQPVRRAGWLLVSVGLAGTMSTAVLSVGSAAQAAIENPYTGTATAYAAKLTAGNRGIVPLLPGGQVEVTTPLAQAAASNGGTAGALASMAYPGDFVDSVANLGALLGGSIPPGTPLPELPASPVTVKADGSSSEPSTAAGPGYDLSARAGEGRAMAVAKGGLPGGFTTESLLASSSAEPTEDGGVMATATSSVSGVSIADVVTLGTVRSTAVVARTADGTLERSSSIELTGASIAGMPLEIRDGQLVVPVLGAVLPVADAIEQLDALGSLEQGEVSIELTPAEKTPDGIVAPGIEVTWMVPLPEIPLPAIDVPVLIPGQPGIGPIPESTAVVTARLAHAEAATTLTELPPPPDPPDPVDPTPPAEDDGGATAGGSTTGGSTASIDPPSSDLPTGGTTGEETSEEVPAAAQLAGYRIRAPFDALNIYLALVVVGLFALGSGQLARLQGVKTSWKS